MACTRYLAELLESPYTIPEKKLTGRFEAQVVHFIFPLALVYLVDHTFRHTLPFLCFLLRFERRSEKRLEVGDTDSTWYFSLHFWDRDLENGRRGIRVPGRVFELYPEERKVRRGYFFVLND